MKRIFQGSVIVYTNVIRIIQTDYQPTQILDETIVRTRKM